jgi:glutamate formiminotransferase
VIAMPPADTADAPSARADEAHGGVPLVELVPNVSTADAATLETLASAMQAAGATVLDTTADRWHNRSVITAVAAPAAAVAVAVALVDRAREVIDMRSHRGVHPRVGAVDVIPMVPWRGVSMADCVTLARDAADQVAAACEVPVYLYERAAERPDRVALADIRRGGLESLRETIALDPYRAPDRGPARVHPTLGAVVIGARELLVAFNVFIGPADHLPAAQAIARAIRASSGGLPGLKAIAVEVDGQAQVSMNLVDLSRISLMQAYAAVARRAESQGLTALRGELIGLVPAAAASLDAQSIPGLMALPGSVLETRLQAAGL